MTVALPAGARVLIVRTGALGDIVHALPVLTALTSARPDLRVDWLVDARYADVLRLVEGLAGLVIVRATTDGGDDGAVRFAGTGGLLRAVTYLRRQAYAVALDLQGLMKSAALARGSGAQRVVGFERRALREPAARWAYHVHVPVDDRGHVVQKNLAMLGPLGVTSSEVAFPWRPFASQVADTVRSDARVVHAGGFVLLNAGAAWENKRWDPTRFGTLATRLAAEFGWPSLVCWGPGERDRADAVVAASAGHAFATPPTALHDVLALARAARLVVSGDTGPLHLAASVDAPLVGLFGPTRPERNGPWRLDDVSVSRAAECVCFHKRRCLTGAPCVDRIGVDEVFDACVRRLSTEAASV